MTRSLKSEYLVQLGQVRTWIGNGGGGGGGGRGNYQEMFGFVTLEKNSAENTIQSIIARHAPYIRNNMGVNTDNKMYVLYQFPHVLSFVLFGNVNERTPNEKDTRMTNNSVSA